MKKAFTIIELLVVLAIFGILSGLIVIRLKNAKDEARLKRSMEFAHTVRVSLGSDLVGEWRFNEGINGTCSGGKDACDNSGNGNHGTNNSANWVTSFSSSGNALEFTGSNGVNCGNPDSIKYSGDVTICFWAYCYNIASPSRQNPINKAYGGEGTMTMETDGALSFFFGSCGGNCSPYCNMQAHNMFTSNNQWIYICATRDVSKRQVNWYKNGKDHEVRTWSNPLHDPVVSGNDFIIGDGYTNPFNGIIDEVRIYNRALTTAEIQKHYAEGAVKHGIVLK